MLPVYNILSENDVKQIHTAALRVLAETGIELDHPKAQEVLSGLGAKISDNKKRVFLPPELVEKMLARAPREFLCAARDPQFDMRMKRGNTYTRQGGGPIMMYDMRNASAHDLTLKDAQDSVRLVNALPHINAPSTMSPQDIDPHTYDIATVKMVLENTQKHFWALTTGVNHLRYELELAAATVGGKEELKNDRF